jgi:ABC-type transport system substrate-binding protein
VAKVLATLVSIICLSSSFADTSKESSKILEIPILSAHISLDPTQVQDANSLWIARQINCQLVRLVRKSAKPEAAENVEYLDQKTIKITIRSDLKFHDGTNVTASDVAASLENLKKSRRVIRNVFNWIKRIEVKNERVLIFYLKKEVPQFLDFLGAPNYAIFPKSFLVDAEKNKTLWNKPIGCGGYRIDSELNASEEIHLSPIASGLPILFKLKTSDQIAASEAEKTAILESPFSKPDLPSKSFIETATFDPKQVYFGLNTQLKRWKNRADRCSFFSNLDRLIIQKKYGDSGRTATSLFPEGILGFDKGTALPWNYNKSIKKPIVEVPFQLTILGISVPDEDRATYRDFVKTANGAEVNIHVLDNPMDFGPKFLRTNTDGLIIGLKSNFLDGYEYLLPFSERSANFTGFFDPEIVKAINSSQDITVPSERSKSYQSIEEKILSECVIYPLITFPSRKIFLNRTFSFPGIGEVPINEYYLGDVR